MTVLDFTDSEPKINSRSQSKADALTGNAAFYERLQGTRKSGIARYSWVALPIAAVAIFGIVAATSTPNRSADNIAAGPVDAKPAMVAVTAAPVAAPAEQAAATVTAPQAAPAPVHVARRAAPVAPREPTVSAAAATRPQTVPAPTVMAAPAPAPAPAPAEIQAPTVSAAPAPIEAAPTEAAPAPAEAPAQ
jgi:hypothetical protein